MGPITEPVSSPSRLAALGWVAGICAVLALLYMPLVGWLTRVSFHSTQISNAGVVVALTLLVCVRSVIGRKKFAPDITAQGIGLVMAGFLVLLLATQVQQLALLLVLISFCLSFAGVITFLFGPAAAGQFVPAFAAFVVFGVLAGLFPTLDWPLREIAGSLARGMLARLGMAATTFVVDTAPAQLMLTVEGKSYVVATECNGFGFLTSYLILAAVLGSYYHLTWTLRLGLMLSAIPIGLVLNSLRIVGICLVAGRIPVSYTVIHEAFGVAFLFAGMGLMFLLARRVRPATSSVAR